MVDLSGTPTACVIGHPIAHSLSPVIHRHWLHRLGLEGDYVTHEVAPTDLSAFVKDLRSGLWLGANVTLPHKEAVLALVDAATPAAQAIGASNTLAMDRATGLLTGDNTDAIGFARNLDDCIPDWRSGHHALVLGAGGAARAIIFACLDAGYEIVTVANRTLERAQTLADVFGNKVRPAIWDRATDIMSETDLLVNTTALGMAGKPDLEIGIDRLPAHALVADIVYRPLETDLLRNAAARGLKTADGLGMLLHQAAPGFARWFGRTPPVDAHLRQSVLAHLGQA